MRVWENPNRILEIVNVEEKNVNIKVCVNIRRILWITEWKPTISSYLLILKILILNIK